MRASRTAALGTLNRDNAGPHVSVVNVATSAEGWPVIFVSKLAWHTQNILADPRASLLMADLPKSGDALTGARVSAMGRMEMADSPAIKRRYLAAHPEASGYIGFGDFSFWILKPEQVHAVAGFGRIETLSADEVFLSVPGWAELEEGAIQHMNEDHADAVARYAARLHDGEGQAWTIAAIDPDGCHLVSGSENSLWLPFDKTARNADELRQQFIALTRL